MHYQQTVACRQGFLLNLSSRIMFMLIEIKCIQKESARQLPINILCPNIYDGIFMCI